MNHQRLFSLLIIAGLFACGQDFDPAHKLKKTRVLAIAAEPPSPVLGETSIFRPLYYLKGTDQVLRTTWSFCPFPVNTADGYKCPLTQAEFDAMLAGLGMGPAPSMNLGEGETGQFINPFPPEMLATLCSNQALPLPTGAPTEMGSSAQIFTCTFGFPITVRMEAETTAGPVTAVIQLNLPTDSSPPNQNPTMGAIRMLKPIAEQVLDEAGTVIVPREERLTLDLAVEETASETFRGRLKADNGEYLKDATGAFVLGDVRESLNVAWYAEGGSFGEGHGPGGSFSGYNPDAKDPSGAPIPFSLVREMFWEAPSVQDDPRTSYRMFIILRDNRGGVTWQTVRVGVTP